MKIIRNTLHTWLPLTTAITLICGIIYGTVQQTFRSGANDPQIQMAYDTARALTSGQTADTLLPAGEVDLAQSLASYLILFDAGGNPVASNALLHGQIPTPPPGVFEYAREHGEDRITWQPESGVRSAIVVVPVNDGSGFVLAGRSLREVEMREENLVKQLGIGWVGTVLGTLFITILVEIFPFTRREA